MGSDTGTPAIDRDPLVSAILEVLAEAERALPAEVRAVLVGRTTALAAALATSRATPDASTGDALGDHSLARIRGALDAVAHLESGADLGSRLLMRIEPPAPAGRRLGVGLRTAGRRSVTPSAAEARAAVRLAGGSMPRRAGDPPTRR